MSESRSVDQPYPIPVQPHATDVTRPSQWTTPTASWRSGFLLINLGRYIDGPFGQWKPPIALQAWGVLGPLRWSGSVSNVPQNCFSPALTPTQGCEHRIFSL